MANDKKLGKLLSEKFPDPKPEVQALFGCYPWVGISPDSFNVRMQDSTFRDSVRLAGASKPGKTPGGEETSEEGAAGKDPNQQKDEDKDKKGGIFRRLFNHKEEEEKKRQQRK